MTRDLYAVLGDLMRELTAHPVHPDDDEQAEGEVIEALSRRAARRRGLIDGARRTASLDAWKAAHPWMEVLALDIFGVEGDQRTGWVWHRRTSTFGGSQMDSWEIRAGSIGTYGSPAVYLSAATGDPDGNGHGARLKVMSGNDWPEDVLVPRADAWRESLASRLAALPNFRRREARRTSEYRWLLVDFAGRAGVAVPERKVWRL